MLCIIIKYLLDDITYLYLLIILISNTPFYACKCSKYYVPTVWDYTILQYPILPNNFSTILFLHPYYFFWHKCLGKNIVETDCGCKKKDAYYLQFDFLFGRSNPYCIS